MTTAVDKLITEFEEAVRKRTLSTAPLDKEIAEILYQSAKKALSGRLIQQSKLIVQLSKGAH